MGGTLICRIGMRHTILGNNKNEKLGQNTIFGQRDLGVGEHSQKVAVVGALAALAEERAATKAERHKDHGLFGVEGRRAGSGAVPPVQAFCGIYPRGEWEGLPP